MSPMSPNTRASTNAPRLLVLLGSPWGQDISVEDAVASGRQYSWKVPATAQRGDRAFIYHYPDKEFVAKGHLLSDPRIKHGHRLASVGGLAPLTQPVSLQSLRARVRWRFLKSPRRAAQVPPEFVAGIIGTLDRPLAQEILDVPDDPAERQGFARRVRRGQGAFRKALLRAYANRCAILGSGPEEVLDACHIDLHAKTGRNESVNGLLLRADLHNLFDDGLLQIDAVSLQVHLKPSLRDTDYWPINGRILRDRTDHKRPDATALRRRSQRPKAPIG